MQVVIKLVCRAVSRAKLMYIKVSHCSVSMGVMVEQQQMMMVMELVVSRRENKDIKEGNTGHVGVDGHVEEQRFPTYSEPATH